MTTPIGGARLQIRYNMLQTTHYGTRLEKFSRIDSKLKQRTERVESGGVCDHNAAMRRDCKKNWCVLWCFGRAVAHGGSLNTTRNE